MYLYDAALGPFQLCAIFFCLPTLIRIDKTDGETHRQVERLLIFHLYPQFNGLSEYTGD